jgi:hypothetical protein
MPLPLPFLLAVGVALCLCTSPVCAVWLCAVLGVVCCVLLCIGDGSAIAAARRRGLCLLLKTIQTPFNRTLRWFHMFTYMPNPIFLFQTPSTTSRAFCDLYMAPAHFGPAANIIPKLYPRHHKTSTVTPELAAGTSRQSSNGSGLSFGAHIAKMRLYLHSTAVLRHDWNPEVKISPPPGSD